MGNDGDGLTDCVDLECAADAACAAEICDDQTPCEGDAVCNPRGHCATPATEDPRPIARPGLSIDFSGSLDEEDLTWIRLDEACDPAPTPPIGVETYFYDTFRIVNDSDHSAAIEVHAWWEDDGYLHIYRDPFVADEQAGCVIGNDDDDDQETVLESHLDRVEIAAGEVLVIVASTFTRDDAIGPYTLTVETLGTLETCNDLIDNDDDGATDCGDDDCAEICEGDADADGFDDEAETDCGTDPLDPFSVPVNSDDDAQCDLIDNCPQINNPGQDNYDGDLLGICATTVTTTAPPTPRRSPAGPIRTIPTRSPWIRMLTGCAAVSTTVPPPPIPTRSTQTAMTGGISVISAMIRPTWPRSTPTVTASATPATSVPI